MRSLLTLALLLPSGVAFASGARQHKSCALRTIESGPRVSLQLFAGPASYGDIESDVFAVSKNGIELKFDSIKVYRPEKIVSTATSADGTTVTIKSMVGLTISLADGSRVSGKFLCKEIDYTP